MSETAPRSNPRLDDFEANKAAHEREQFENELYADAGKGDFSDEARKRVEEADAYERHMEELAKRERTPLNDDNSAEAIRARIDASYKFDADHPESRAYDQEWDDAIAENDRHDADKMNEEFDAKAKADAIEAKIAADPKLRRMNYLAEQIAELRNKPVDENADDDIIRLKGLEDNLESYLSKYAESDDFDAELADLMIERSAAAPAAKEKEAEKTDEKKARSPEEYSETDSPEQMIADISDLISKETDPVKRAEAQEKLREIMEMVEKALEGKDKKDDLSDLDDKEAPKVGDGEESDLDDLDDKEAPKVKDDADLDDLDDKEAPKVGDPEKKDTDGEEHDLEDLDELSAPEVGEAPDEAEGKRPWYKRAWDRAGLIFVIGVNKAGERLHLPEKRSTRVATAIGAVTLLAVGGALAWKYGFHHGGSGGNGNADPNAVPTPAPKQPSVEVVPPVTPKGPEIPVGSHFAHPYNWMDAAMDNGSITPPKGMNAEQALHHYGELAEKAGHDVQWHDLPNGLESISIDGRDSTEYVADVIAQVAK